MNMTHCGLLLNVLSKYLNISVNWIPSSYSIKHYIYQKAKELTWLKPIETAGVVVRLGGFHFGLNFLKCIGQHFEDSGLKDVWGRHKSLQWMHSCKNYWRQILEPFCESTQTNIWSCVALFVACFSWLVYLSKCGADSSFQYNACRCFDRIYYW